ncbi:hypothetical protein LINPERHAP2_LOCUS18613 [Linum perenne]
MEYQVRGPRGQFVVDLLTRTCACGRWQLSGIPCPHAIRCIQYCQEDPERYVDNCYSVDVYKSTYERSVRPLNDSSQWSRSGLEPLHPPQFPPPKRGAKQTKRRKEAGELAIPRTTRKGVAVVAVSRKGASMTCSTCKKKGHNKRGCKDSGTRSTSSIPATANQPTTVSTYFVLNQIAIFCCKDSCNPYFVSQRGSPLAASTSQRQRPADATDFMPTPHAPLNDSPARNTRSKASRRI